MDQKGSGPQEPPPPLQANRHPREGAQKHHMWSVDWRLTHQAQAYGFSHRSSGLLREALLPEAVEGIERPCGTDHNDDAAQDAVDDGLIDIGRYPDRSMISPSFARNTSGSR
jgi:hypothetical protein